MKIIIASDSFKGSLTSQEVGECISDGFKKIFPSAEFVIVPISDGGEGFLNCITVNRGILPTRSLSVSDPLGNQTVAQYSFLDEDTAVLDIASASGIGLVDRRLLNPLKTSTHGTGELIIDAVMHGAKKIILGLGGTATNDAGTGILQALGIKLLDGAGRELKACGESLINIRSIEKQSVPVEVLNCQFILPTDVTNPLLGTNGATYVFGIQKGADNLMLSFLEKGMKNWETVVAQASNTHFLDHPGAGAAGGTAFSMISLFNAKIVSGLDFLLDSIGFNSLLNDADLVITGEGKLDDQTRFGKVPYGIARRVKTFTSIPVIAINGSIEGENAWVYGEGIDAISSTVQSFISESEIMGNAKQNLIIAAERTARSLVVLRKTNINQLYQN